MYSKLGSSLETVTCRLCLISFSIAESANNASANPDTARQSYLTVSDELNTLLLSIMNGMYFLFLQ